MADSMDVSALGSQKVDLTRWKKLTAQEIIKEESNGEEIPAEIIAWAEQMAAFSRIPDNVTYEQVDGETGLEALEKLGIEENPVGAEDTNAIAPGETEEPGAVKDPAQAEKTDDENDGNIFMNAKPGQAADEIPAEEDEDVPPEVSGLADDALTTDPEEIRKRKERKGQPQ